MTNKFNLDYILTYIFIKRLITPITQTPAYKMKLVNNAGRVIREPETEKEKEALTILDKLIFKMKRLLGTKLITLNNFLYMTTMSNDMYSKLIIKGTIDQRAEVDRIKKDIKKMQETYNMELDELLYCVLNEDLRNV